MQDFQKSLLLLCNNILVQLETPLGRSLTLHFVVLVLLAINFDFALSKNKLEVIPVESISVSVIDNKKAQTHKSSFNDKVPKEHKNLENAVPDPKFLDSKFKDVFSKLKNKQKQQKEIKKANQEFDKLFKHKLLKNLENKKSKENEENETKSNVNKTGNNSGFALSTLEEDELRNQIIPNWLIPAGVKNAEDLTVEVLIEIASDGTIIKTKILNPSNETNFKIAAQSALRALLLSSPLKITSKRLKKLKEFIFNFNPKDVL